MQALRMNINNAYFIKLGRAGCWEADSIKSSRMRVGWSGQALEDINAGRWPRIEQQLRAEQPGKPGVSTTDLNRLRDIATSTAEDIWITFHANKLWWTRVKGLRVEADSVSKFRRTERWSDRAIDGRPLFANELPGRLAQLQAFRGTVCRVADKALLARVLQSSRSSVASDIAQRREALSRVVANAIAELHWKDFETLVDLVFRDAGWQRVSILGQQAKGFDLELREPVTGDEYVVQVKSQADRADLERTLESYLPDSYRRLFFVVHTPEPDLLNVDELPSYVDLVLPNRLAELAVAAGLSKWIEDKVA
jgi:hypothetical protein